MTAKQTVLVTGATGFVGSRAARRFLDAGAKVRAIVRRTGASPELARPSYEEIEGDFVDRAIAARAAEGCDLIVHAAATSGPELAPVQRVNVDGTASMLAAAKAANVPRYVQISTISVYDLTGVEVVDEETPLKVKGDPYGSTKADADRLVIEAMKRPGFAAAILRPGALLGVHPTSTWAVKVPGRIRDRQIKLLRDGGNTMPFVHVDDLVDAIELVARDDRAKGGVYNVAAHRGSWRDYSDEVRSWFGTAPLGTMSDAEAGGMSYWVGDVSSARLRSLGWSPKRTYRVGMDEAAEYWRAQVAL